MYGNDFLLAERLVPHSGELRPGRFWVVIESDELCLIREGEADAGELARHVVLAARLASALEA